MSLTLNDLSVLTKRPAWSPLAHRYAIRSATVADLVEVIESEGGEVVESYQAGFSVDERSLVEVPRPGRYIVLAIPDEET